MRKIVSLFLAGCMLAGLVCAGSVPAHAAGTDDIIAAVEAYNLSHGGTGKLVAAKYNDVCTCGHIDERVAITGEAKGVTKGIELFGLFEWKATISGDAQGEALIKANSVILCDGADVRTNGCAVAARTIDMRGGAIAGNLSAEYITLSRNAVVRASEITGSVLSVCDDAELYMENMDSIKRIYVQIGTSATTDLKNRLPSYVLLDEQGYDYTFTMVGNVVMPQSLVLSVRDRLVIPNGTSLTIHGDLLLSNDTAVIIDGKISVTGIVQNYKIADVSGANRRQLWLQSLSWFQFLLRYFFFGWLWMK